MRISITSTATIILSALLLLKESESFSIQSSSPVTKSVLFAQREVENVRFPSAKKANNNKDRLKTYGQVILDRSDTMKAAGFHEISDDKNQYPPLQAGAKTNITLFLLALGYKWYRSIFINKLAIWERQPQWNTVITSKEDEEKANLEAMTCNECGSTIFIAKGRKWFQMPNGYTCYCCGATGEDAFTNTRENLLEEIDDDYFDYEKPLDFVTAAERRKLMKQAGGDEKKANELLTQASAAAAAPEGSDVSEGEVDQPKKKKKKKGKKKKKKKVENGEDIVAESTSKAEDKVEPKMETKKEVKKDGDILDDLDALGLD